MFLSSLNTNLLQWNLDLTKSPGTGQICSLNGGFVISHGITNLRGNDQNGRYVEVIVNDWFLTQSGDFCGNTIVPMSMTYNKLLTEKLLSLDLYHNDFTIRICWLLICSAFICCCVLHIQLVDIVIRYIEVDLTFRLWNMFVISKNSLYRGSLYQSSIPYILL